MRPDVIFVPTPMPVVHLMLSMAGVGAGDVVYDLGCGDGRILIEAAKLGARALGFECDESRVSLAESNIEAAGLSDLAIVEHANMFEQDLSPATVVTMYLNDPCNARMVANLQKMKPGSVVVTSDFRIRGFKEVQSSVVMGCYPDSPPEACTVYLYRIPLGQAAA